MKRLHARAGQDAPFPFLPPPRRVEAEELLEEPPLVGRLPRDPPGALGLPADLAQLPELVRRDGAAESASPERDDRTGLPRLPVRFPSRRRLPAGERPSRRELREEDYGPLPHGVVVANGREPSLFPPGVKEPLVVAARLSWPLAVARPDAGPDGQRFRPRALRAAGALGEEELAALLSRASIFVSAARYEPFGLGPTRGRARGVRARPLRPAEPPRGPGRGGALGAPGGRGGLRRDDPGTRGGAPRAPAPGAPRHDVLFLAAQTAALRAAGLEDYAFEALGRVRARRRA